MSKESIEEYPCPRCGAESGRPCVDLRPGRQHVRHIRVPHAERNPNSVESASSRHFIRARREIILAVEQWAKVDEQHGTLPGHRAEMLRRIRAAKVEVDRAIAIFDKMEEDRG